MTEEETMSSSMRQMFERQRSLGRRKKEREVIYIKHIDRLVGGDEELSNGTCMRTASSI